MKVNGDRQDKTRNNSRTRTLLKKLARRVTRAFSRLDVWKSQQNGSAPTCFNEVEEQLVSKADV